MWLRKIFILLLSVVVFSSAFASNEEQANLQSLKDNDRISVTASLGEGEVSVKEQVVVNIEILTDTWFTKGTRIHRFELNDALVLQRNQFAVNSTERINGKTYSKQLWEVVVYPLKSGEYHIPEIWVELSVRGDHGNVQGYLVTEPISFTATQPHALNDSDIALVGADAKLTQRWEVIRSQKATDANGGLEESAILHIGDAIERTVTLQVEDSSAGLLPTLISEPNEESAFQWFLNRPQLEDHQHRGEYSATRTEKAVYVIEKAGELNIAPIKVLQWDTDQQALRTLEVAGRSIVVQHTFGSFVQAYWLELSTLAIALAMMLSCGHWLKRHYRHLESTGKLPIGLLFLLAIKSKNEVACETLLYRKVLKRHGKYRVGTDPNVAAHPLIKQLHTLRYQHPDDAALSGKLGAIQWLQLWFKHQ